MTFDEILAMHVDPTICGHTMIYEVWQDGEVTSTKAGELFRHRGLHLIDRAIGGDVIDVETMPLRLGKNGSIAVRLYADAVIIHKWINSKRDRRMIEAGPHARGEGPVLIDPNDWAFKNGLESF